MPAETAHRADAERHPEHPLPEIEVVRGLIEQHAAAFTGPSRAPAAGGVVGIRPEPVGDRPAQAA